MGVAAWGACLAAKRFDVRTQLAQLAIKPAVEDWEPAPTLRVEPPIVDMEPRGEPFALPLVARPEREEPLDPLAELSTRLIRKLRADRFEDFKRRQLIADC